MIHPSPSRRTHRAGQRLLKTLCSTLISAACAGWLSAQATPVLHGVSAANVTVQQNDTGNAATSVTLIPTVSINDFRVTVAGTSRADYGVQIGPVATNNVVNGILISSISDNGRNNGETNPWAGTIYGTSAVDSGATANPGSSGVWWVPVFGNATDKSVSPAAYSYNEYNFDFSAGYFPYAKGWYGGWLCNSGGTNGGVNNRFIGNTNLIFGTDAGADVQAEVSGNAIVNLTRFGLNSLSNAVMICCGGKNEENFVASKPNADGTWTLTCRDDQSGGAEQDYIAWVVVPLANTNVITGRIAGNPNSASSLCINELQNAPFIATHIGTGTYHLTIPGVTPGHGVLIISADEDQRAGDTGNADNFVSYQATNDGWIIQTRDTGNNQTPNLQNIANPNVNNASIGQTIVDFVYIPAPTAGITVTPTNGLATSQNGGTASFSVVLDAPPTAEVDLNLASSDSTIGLPSTNLLVFMPTNWNIPQTVTVTGVDSTVATVQNYTVNFSAVTGSADTNYNGVTAASVALVNIPNDSPGIFLVPSSGLTTTGAGGTATFEVILNFAPSSDVTVGFSSSDTTQGVVSPASVTFNSTNWSTPQVITVTGVDDGLVNGDIAYQINSSPAVSSDSAYNGLSAGSVSVLNLDNDVAGVITSVTNGISVLEGNTVNFTVALSAPPISNVTLTYASSDPTAGTLSPTAVTFTPANWNVPQTIALTGVANPAANGNVNYALTATVTSSNPGYATLVIPDLAATTTKVVGLNAGTTIYGLGMPPVGVDGRASASDAIDFSGATLTFALTTNADSTDALGIRNDGTALGQISVADNIVSYSGSPIGTFTGGAGTTPLVVTLQNGVIGDQAAALMEAVTFSTTTTNNFATRHLQVTLNYGAGSSSAVSKSIRVGQLRVTQYQNGADYGYGIYNGEADCEIAATNSGALPTGSSTVNGLFVQADNASNEHEVLMRFDNLVGTNVGQIPPGSIIVAADVSLNILNTGDGFAFNRMLIPWDGSNSTWNSFGYPEFGIFGITPDDVTAKVEYDSQLGNFTVSGGVGSQSATGTGYVSIGVTPDIQAWVNGEENDGWVLNTTPWPGNLTDGTGFTPSEDPNVNIRPQLRVYWLPPATPGTSFRYGVNDYTNVQDTEIVQTSPHSTNYAAAITIWSDGPDLGQAPDATEALIQFGNIIGTGTNQIPPGAHIEVAMLNIANMDDANCPGDGGQFYALLQPWSDTTTTWSSWDPNGNGILTDGVQAAITPTVTAGNVTLNPNVVGGYHAYEVTADVQNWANGAANNGWAVLPWRPNGSDGWGINTSEDPITNSRPQLTVYYTLSAGFIATPSLLPLTASASAVQVKFAGTIGATYTVWRTDSLNGTWNSIGTATVSADGTATFNDPSPLPIAGFYRVSKP